jgi:hypothetical protein
MLSVIGIFGTLKEARRAEELLNLPGDRVSVIAPQPREQEDEDIGKALGGVVGGSLGIAVGSTIGTAAASLAVPGVGPILATGAIAGLLFGTGGAIAGYRAGEKLDERNAPDPAHDPHDQFFFHHALRRGRAIVLALAESSQEAERVKATLRRSGAKDVDAMREEWWSELRGGEEGVYRGDFAAEEKDYRRGFEAALVPEQRGQQIEAPADVSPAYREGFRRGAEYFRKLQEEQETVNR